jgi:hypothetical protein
MKNLVRVFGSLVALIGLAIAVPAAAQPDPEVGQTMAIADVRTGDGPCGFAVKRTVNGQIAVTPSLDQTGHMVLEVTRVNLHGSLTNPDNGKMVEIKWVNTNGSVGLETTQSATRIALSLTGHLFRGYDMSPSALDMSLPADGAALIDFEPGGPATEPWAHVCGMLS